MVHTVELNWGKPYIIYSHLPLYLRMLSAKLCVSTAMFGPTVTKYLNLLHFKPEKGVSGPLRSKGPDYELVMVQYISYQEILVKIP